MKLPPKPDDVESVGMSTPARHSRTSSLKPSPKASPKPSPQASPRRPVSPLKEEYAFEPPRELVTTLPPLTLTPSQSSNGFDTAGITRPPLRTHATEASQSSQHLPTSPLGLASPVEALDLERNAWADDAPTKEQEVRMTFE